MCYSINTSNWRITLPTQIGICLGCVTFFASGAQAAAPQQTENHKIQMARTKDALTARELLTNIKSVGKRAPSSSLLAASDLRPAIALEKSEQDADLRAAIDEILSKPLSQKGQQTSRSTVVRKLIEALKSEHSLTHRDVLQSIYLNSYTTAENLQQLAEAKLFAKLLHPLMMEWGIASQGDFERSDIYKKLVRKQRLLASTKND